MGYPTTSDGKQIILSSLYPPGVTLYIAGAGDDAVLGRGKGPSFAIASNGVMGAAKTDVVTWSFNDYCFMSGGGESHENGVVGDSCDFTINAPASTVVPNPSGKGAATLGPGGVIIPAAGNGTHDVVKSVPVPSSTGLWTWSSPDTGLGVVAPYDPAATLLYPDGNVNSDRYHLMTVAVPLNKFMASLPLVGSHAQTFLVPAIKPQKVLPQWQFSVTVRNSGHVGLALAWYVTVARMAST